VSTWLANVGIFSYSLYLIHNPVRGVAKQVIQWVLPSNNSPLLFVGKAIALSVVGYWGGRAFFHLVERHFLNSPVQPYGVEPAAEGTLGRPLENLVPPTRIA
jgi:peptidoglycan/LPS O-acetylase OafA/YrhL